MSPSSWTRTECSFGDASDCSRYFGAGHHSHDWPSTVTEFFWLRYKPSSTPSAPLCTIRSSPAVEQIEESGRKL
jgi:hypothetical protein